MSDVDLWAAIAATVAASAVAMRAHMLRPRQRAWTHAPGVVWGSLTWLAIVLGTRAYGLWCGAAASAGEAMVYTALAVSSAAMLWNLNRNGRQADVERQAIRREVEEAMKASGPPAAYGGEWRR
jgi:hypothetical protein